MYVSYVLNWCCESARWWSGDDRNVCEFWWIVHIYIYIYSAFVLPSALLPKVRTWSSLILCGDTGTSAYVVLLPFQGPKMGRYRNCQGYLYTYCAPEHNSENCPTVELWTRPTSVLRNTETTSREFVLTFWRLTSTIAEYCTANLLSCILYIYSTNIGTEYFIHGVYCPFFFSSKCSLFHNSIAFSSCIIHILYTGCAKIKKNNSVAKSLIMESGCVVWFCVACTGLISYSEACCCYNFPYFAAQCVAWWHQMFWHIVCSERATVLLFICCYTNRPCAINCVINHDHTLWVSEWGQMKRWLIY